MVKENKEIVECKNISKRYGYFFALKNISFKVKENTIFGIVGSNGAGKTTLIKILSGLLKPSLGKVRIKGFNYEKNSFDIKKIIGISTDESFLYEDLTINENLIFYDKLHYNFDKNKIQTKIKKFTELFGLINWLYEPIRNLSHGMKQKVELIRVLMHYPSILFLDEPFSGLDFKVTELLINYLEKLKREENITVILTTHKIEILSKICDNSIVLKEGKINRFISWKENKEVKIESYF